MGQNQIFTSPLGLGLGIGLGTAVGASLIAITTYVMFKYAGQGEDIRDSFSELSERGSSFFTVAEDPYRDTSFSQEEKPNAYQQFGQDLSKKKTVNTGSKVVRTTGATGGKLSKKRRRKNRVKKYNTLRK